MTIANTPYYEAPDSSLWHGRSGEHDDPRYHQVIQLIDLNTSPLSSIEDNSLLLIGFCSDEGVKRNQGRVGAALGSYTLKTYLAKLPYLSSFKIYDIGNIKCIDSDLEQAQEILGQLINQCHALGHKTMVFGGGHETAWGHYLGLKTTYPSLGIFNFDAHFDLRTDTHSTSGTPFLQISHDKQKLNQPFHYFCYGIQKTANTPDLFRKANELGVTYLEAAEITIQPTAHHTDNINQFLSKFDYLYITICMDVFNAGIAPGVSAPAPFGLMHWHVLPILNLLISSKKVVSIDIVELSPPFDVDCQTARLASSLAAEVIYCLPT